MSDDKYVVLKREGMEDMLKELILKLGEDATADVAFLFGKYQLLDAVVIRRQDVFAPPALDAYANSIVVALQLIPETGEPGVKERLKEIADYFADQAEKSWHDVRKLPD